MQYASAITAKAAQAGNRICGTDAVFIKGAAMPEPIKTAIAEHIRSFRLPRYENIPNVGLYLEQTVSYIMEYLELLQNGAVTGSMVSNYVKKKLIRNPVRKQYHRDQIAQLIFIAVTKPILSLDNIQVLLNIRERSYDAQTAYDYFCDEFEQVLRQVFGLEASPGLPSIPKANPAEGGKMEEKEILRSTVVAVAHKIYLEKWIEEYE